MKFGRNDPCPCGSGKKFKKCCQGKAASSSVKPGTLAQGPVLASSERNQLISLFNAGQHAELEALAMSLVNEHPDSGFLWKMLGAALKSQGKDALLAMQRAAKLLPEDADAHISLGNLLCGLGKFDAAVASYRRGLEIRPHFAEAHSNLGAALKNLGYLDDAVASYRASLKLKPGSVEAQYNLGNTLYSLGQLEEAVESYRCVLKVNPGLAVAHANLGTVLKELGQPDQALASYRRALEITPHSAEVLGNMGVILYELGRLDEAIACYREALEINPGYAEVHYNLGNALQDSGQPEGAVASYCAAIDIQPALAKAHSSLGNLLHDLGQLDDALACYRNALKINPKYAEVLSNMGNVQHDLGQLDEAIACYRKALEIMPDLVKANSNLGAILMETGKEAEGKSFLDRAMALAPGDARPLATALFYIPCQQNDPRLPQLETVYARRQSLPLKDRIRLNFTMGTAMKNIGEYDRSFDAYQEGNQLCHQARPFNEIEDEAFLERSMDFYTADLFEQYAQISNELSSAPETRVPIFIVGMPRSGTTLIEQILASHPDVYGAGELPVLDNMAERAAIALRQAENPESALIALRSLGKEYLDAVWKLAPDARCISDKLPGNYRHLGLIHLMLPNAKIIHSMRDPMDTCFACYALNFKSGHDYSNDLGTLGRHYLRYKKLMAHWDRVLPQGRILDVHYESNVADPENKARRMLDYLGLPWESSCLKFYETERAVRTPSVLQVHQPIYTSSVGRWKRYKKHLGPLLEILNPHAT